MWRSILLVAGLFGLARAQTEAPRVAVIEAIVPAGTPAAQGMDWTDAVRGALQRCLGDSHLVLTRQNIEALLPPGTNLADCEGDCEVETGRNVGADWVTSVRVTAKAVAVLVHRTADGQVHSRGFAQRGDDTVEALKRATQAACAPLAPEPAAAPPRVIELTAKPSSKVRPLHVRVTSPHGATVWRGERRLGVTPVQVPIAAAMTGRPSGPGAIELRVEATGYESADVIVRHKGWTGGEVSIDLGQLEGQVRLDGLPKEARVRVDAGHLVTARALRLAPGPHELRVEHPCYRSTPITFEVEAGEVVHPDLASVTTCPHLRLTSNAPGTTARIDGGRTVTLPTSVIVAEGEPIEVDFEATGYEPTTMRITAPTSGGQTVLATLKRRAAEVTVIARNVWGDPCPNPISIDGTSKTAGRWVGPVDEGRRHFRSGCGVSKRLRLRLKPKVIEMIHGGHAIGIGLRTDPGRTVQGLLVASTRLPSAPHIRLDLGLALGSLLVPDRPTFIAGLDIGVGVPLTRWLDINGRVTWGDAETCSSSAQAGRDCDAEFHAVAGGVRLQYGWVAADVEYGAVYEDVRSGSGRWHAGPSGTLWFRLPLPLVLDRNK